MVWRHESGLASLQSNPTMAESVQVTVEGVPPDTYLERFAWNEAKYPPRRPLKETVAAITETAQKLEDELKACPAFLHFLEAMYCTVFTVVCLSCCSAQCTLWRRAVRRLHVESCAAYFKSWQANMQKA